MIELRRVSFCIGNERKQVQSEYQSRCETVARTHSGLNLPCEFIHDHSIDQCFWFEEAARYCPSCECAGQFAGLFLARCMDVYTCSTHFETTSVANSREREIGIHKNSWAATAISEIDLEKKKTLACRGIIYMNVSRHENAKECATRDCSRTSEEFPTFPNN